jgi:stalled ribosome rescue protein Dom34
MSVHAVVWLDHHEARIFHVDVPDADESTVLAPQHHVHRHPKGHGEGREHPDDAHRFFEEIARALSGVDAILLVGPAAAKDEFFGYLKAHDHRMEAKVIGVETVDHPTDGQIVAMARRAFQASHRMG